MARDDPRLAVNEDRVGPAELEQARRDLGDLLRAVGPRGGGWTAARAEPFHGPTGELLDTAAEPGSVCRYRLSAVGALGDRTFLGEIEAEGPALGGLTLHVQRNPSPGRVFVAWNLPSAGEVRLEAFAPTGRRLCVLRAEATPAGPGQVAWDGKDTAGRPVSGVVWLRLVTAAGTARERVVLVH